MQGRREPGRNTIALVGVALVVLPVLSGQNFVSVPTAGARDHLSLSGIEGYDRDLGALGAYATLGGLATALVAVAAALLAGQAGARWQLRTAQIAPLVMLLWVVVASTSGSSSVDARPADGAYAAMLGWALIAIGNVLEAAKHKKPATG